MKTQITLLLYFLCSFTHFNLSAQTFDASTLPVGGAVYAMAHDATYTYVGGEFNMVGGNVTQGEAFDLTTLQMLNLPAVKGNVAVCIGDGNGGWYIGGSFTQVGGVIRNGLAHILANNMLDLNWNPNVNAQGSCNGCPWINQIVINGTDMFVTGYFNQIGGVIRNKFAKINVATGQVDTSWNPNPNDDVRQMIFVGDDMFVCGGFTGIGGLSRKGIAKLNKNTGQVDATWNPNPNNFGSVRNILLYGTSLFMSYEFSTLAGQNINYIAKISTTGIGAADANWNPNPNLYVDCMVLSGNSLFLGGQFSSIGGQSRKNLAKVNADNGQVDASWNPIPSGQYYANGYISKMQVVGSDLYVMGDFTHLNGQSAKGFTKISTTGTGSISAGWTNTFANIYLNNFVINNNNLYVLAGQGGYHAGNQTIHKANMTSGALDDNWKIQMPMSLNNAYGNMLHFQNNTVYVGGNFPVIGGTKRSNLARFLKSDNSLDVAWNPEVNGKVSALSVVNGSLYVGGQFNSIGGVSRNSLAKVSTTGTGEIEATWNPNITLNNLQGYVATFAADAQNLYVGGSFDKIGSTTRNNIAKLNLGTGALDATWNPNANDSVRNILLSNGELFVLGRFSNIGGAQRSMLAKLNADGQANASWNPNTNNNFLLSMILKNNSLYVGGWIQNIGGQNKQGVAKLDLTTGNADANWQVSTNGLSFDVKNIWASNQNLYISVDYGNESKITIVNLATGATNLEIIENSNMPAYTMRFSNGHTNGVVEGNDMYIFGGFSEIHGQNRLGFAKIPVGSLGGIIVPVGALSDFFTNPALPSASQNFVLSGFALTNNVELSLSTPDWELSTNNTNWSNTLSLTPNIGDITQTIYVRLKSGLSVGNKSAQITISSVGFANKTVNLSGTVSALGGIIVPVGTLSDFFTNPALPSASQNFLLNASYLTDNVGLSLSTPDWELSTNNTGWASTLLVQTNNGTITNQIVYVRLKNNLLAGNKNATLLVSSTGFPSQSIALSGAVNGFAIVSTANLTGFITNTTQPSSSKTFTISGTGFIADVTVGVPSTDWEMSINNTNWSNTLTFVPASWTTTSKLIYIRLKAGLTMGNKIATLTVNTLGSNPQSVNLNGTVIINGSVITMSTDALNNFQSNTTQNSNAQTFGIYGTGFVGQLSASVSTTDWELSMDNNLWASSLQILPTNGKVDNQLVYVRLKKGLSQGVKLATLTISTTAAESQSIALRGEITEPNALSPALQAAVKVYPNPSATGKFYLTMGDLQIERATVQLLNTQGKSIYQTTITDLHDTISIDLPTLPTGMYLLQIDTNKGRILKKIVRN